MKKKLLLVAVVLGFATAAMAQPRAIGGRLGKNLEFSYQHSMSGQNYFQIDAGLINYYSGIEAVGTYNWIFATPQWGDYGSWEWFAGVGAGLGYNWHIGNAYWKYRSYNAHDYYYDAGHFYLGAAGNIGLSFTFPFNLQLSVDYRPMLGVSLGEYYYARDYRDAYERGTKRVAAFYVLGLYDFGLSVRYAF